MRRKTGRYRVDFTSVPPAWQLDHRVPGRARSRECLGPAGSTHPQRDDRSTAVHLAGRDLPEPPDASQARLSRRGTATHTMRTEVVPHKWALWASWWSRKFRVVRSRWSWLAIPSAPMPTLKNLTTSWIRPTRERRCPRLLDALALQGPDAPKPHARRRADLYALDTISLSWASGIPDLPGARPAFGGQWAIQPRWRLWHAPDPRYARNTVA